MEGEFNLKKNGFMEGAIIATLAIIISKIMGVLYVIPFYRIIGEQGGALYGYAYNIYNTFLVISSAGIPLAISKLTSEYDTKKDYDKKIAMYNIAKKAILIFSVCSFLVCFLFAKPLAHLIIGEMTGGNSISDVAFVIRCVSFALLIIPLLSISRGYLQGHKYIAPSSFSQVIEQITRIIVIILGSFIALRYLHLPLYIAVGISVFAACIGGLAGYAYLFFKMRKINTKQEKPINQSERKEIIKKIIAYCVPFIIINIASNLYNTTDIILLIRGLYKIGYEATTIETITSIYTTWCNKLVMIVKSIASGLTISLIPSIVSSYVNKEKEKVNKYMNKSFKVLLIIILPIVIFISLFANEVWSVFYAQSTYGPIILKMQIFLAVFESSYLLICTAIQGINKTKLVYTSVITGLTINLALDLPFIFLFNKIGLYPYYGAIAASIIGYSISLIIPLVILYKKERYNFWGVLINLPKTILSLVFLYIICLLYKNFMPYHYSFIYNIMYIGIIGVIYVGIYYLINAKAINTLLELNKRRKK